MSLRESEGPAGLNLEPIKARQAAILNTPPIRWGRHDAVALVKDDISALIAEVERLRVEHTRAILHYTLKGYTAGENTDAKHWRQRAEQAELALSKAEGH